MMMNTLMRNPNARLGSLAALAFAFLLPMACDLFGAGLGSKVDTEVPSITLTSPAFGAYVRNTGTGDAAGITFTGKATDDIKVASVVLSWTDKSNAQVTGSITAEVKDGVWTAFIPASRNLADSTYQFVATVIDSSAHSTALPITATVDNTPPTVAVNLTNSGTEETPFNGVEALEGTSKDNGSGVSGLVVKVAGVSIALDESSTDTDTVLSEAEMLSWAASAIDFDGISTSTGIWATMDEAKCDRTSYKDSSGNPVYRALVEVVATDTAGNESVSAVPLYCFINPAFDKPQISSNSNIDMATTSDTFRSGDTIKIIVTDDDAIDFTSCAFSLVRASDSSVVGSSMAVAQSSIQQAICTFQIPDTTGEGVYRLDFSIKDDAAKKDGAPAATCSIASRTLVINNGTKPSLSLAAILPVYKTDTVTITGTAATSFGLQSVKVSVDGGPPVAVTITAGDDADDTEWTWTYTTGTLSGGKHALVVTAADSGSLETSMIAVDGVWKSLDATNAASKAFLVDLAAPTVAVSTAFSEWSPSVYYEIAGTASDADSGVSAVEYSLDSTTGLDGNWKALSGTTSWSSTITLSSGSNTIWVRSVDNAGLKSIPVSGTVKVDLENPVISITSPTTLLRVNGSKGISATATISDAYSGVNAVTLVSCGATPLGAGDYSVSNSGDTYTLTLAQSVVAGLDNDSTYDVTAKVTDKATRSSTASFRIKMDTDKPAVAIAVPSSSTSTINRTIVASGTASDDEILKSVTVSVWNAVSNAYDSLGTIEGTAAYNWTKSIDTTSYQSATYDSNAALAGIQLKMLATALDEAGNENATPVTWSGTIDQNSDRPVIKLTQLSWVSESTSDPNLGYIKGTRTITGTVSDDDGTITALSISTDGVFDTEMATTVENNAWSYSFPDTEADGVKTLYFKVVDAKNAEFVTSSAELSRPRIYEKTASSFVDENVCFIIDTANPEIGSAIQIHKDTGDTVSFENNVALGGTCQAFSVLVPASDSSGIASVAVTLGSTTKSSSTGSSGIYTVGDFSVASGDIANGSHVVTIKVTDGAGLSTSTSCYILVDNTGPSISKYVYPIASTVGATSITSTGDIVNGEITITGTASDNTGGSGLTSVKYQIGKNANLSPSSSLWKSIDTSASSTLYNWEITISRIEDYASTTYATDVDGNGIYELPMVFRLEDAAGNVSVTTTSSYIFLVNPDGDKPIAEISYPDSPTATMGGTVRLFGTAEDDDAVGSVYVQLASDSAFTNPLNGSSGAAATGAESWKISIDLSPYYAYNTIYLRARAVDVNGLAGYWTSTYTITLDSSVPQFSDLYVVNKTTGVTREYESDMYIGGSGSWYLQGTITDDGTVSAIEVNTDADADPEYTLALNPTLFGGSGGSRTFDIPLGTSSEGALSLTIKATDSSSVPKSSQYLVSLNCDNTVPSMGSYLGSTPVTQNNARYVVSSSVTESGSGLERVAFFMVRRSATSASLDRLYAPLTTGGGASSAVYLNTLTWTAGDLPLLALSGATRGSTTSLTHTSLKNTNANVRVGALIRLNGVDHVIKTVSNNATTGTVTWTDGDVPLSVTTASLVYAQVVDHTVEELSNWSSGTLSSITNDEGDGVAEYLEKVGGLYTWTAEIDSGDIPDGPITIYCVAFDKAGNRSTLSETTVVKNNPPLLASVTLGTSLNGDSDTDDANETLAANSLLVSSVGQASASVASDLIAKGYTTADIDILGGNGALKYTLSAKCGSDTTASQVHTLAAFTSSSPIAITKANLQTIGDAADKALIFTIWDSTEELTPESGTAPSQSATLTVTMDVDVTDDVQPRVAIWPFSWTDDGSGSNSLYGGSRDNGHIEFEGAIDDNEGTSLTESDPDVSGKISIRGTVWDSHRLSAIYMRIDGNTMNGTTGSYYSQTYTQVATYNATTNAWVIASTLPAGWTFTVTSNSLTQERHLALWQLDWDSTQISGVVGLDKLIKIVAIDANTTPLVSPSAAAGSDRTAYASYNLPSYQVDVVPYITGVTRTSTMNRSKLGKYPVNSADTLTVTGFNLRYVTGTDVLCVANAEAGTLSSTTTYDTVTPTTTSATVDTELTAISFTTASLSSSGFLRLFVGGLSGIEADNGPNDDSFAYNVSASNPLWTDDLYLSLWTVGVTFNTSSGSGYPSMTSTSGGVLYGAWQDLLNATYYNTVSGTATKIATTYDPADYSDISWGKGATPVGPNVAWLGNHVGMNPQYGFGNLDVSNSGGVFVHGPSARTLYGQNNGGSNFFKAYAAEGSADGQDTNEATNVGTQYGTKWQYLRPRVARYGNQLHVAYFDDFTKAVKYSTFTDDGHNKGTIPEGWMVLDGGYDSQDESGSYAVTVVSSGTNLTRGTGTQNIRTDLYTLTDTTLDQTALSALTPAVTGSSLVGKVVHFYDTNYNNWVARYITAYADGSGKGTITWSEPTTYTNSPVVGNLTSGSIGFYIQSSVGMGGLGVVSQGETRSTAAGEYVAIDVDEEGLPVVVYYDNTTSTLRLARATSTAPASIGSWTRQTVFNTSVLPKDSYAANSGKYVAMKIDSAGGVHVICREGNDGKLLYLYAPKTTGGAAYTFRNSIVVDESASVGKLADLSISEATVGALTTYTPHISYLGPGTGTVNGMRYAYGIDTDADGIADTFEYLIAPASVAVQSGEIRQRSNVEYNQSWSTNTWGIVALGYQGTSFDLMYLKSTKSASTLSWW